MPTNLESLRNLCEKVTGKASEIMKGGFMYTCISNIEIKEVENAK